MKNFFFIIFIIIYCHESLANTLKENCRSKFSKDLEINSFDLTYQDEARNKEKNLKTDYEYLKSINNYTDAYKAATKLYDHLIYLYGYCDYRSYTFRSDFIYDLFSSQGINLEPIKILLKHKNNIENIIGKNNEYYLDLVSDLGIKYYFAEMPYKFLEFSKEAFELSLKINGEFDINTISEIQWYTSALIEADINKEESYKLLKKYENYLYNLIYQDDNFTEENRNFFYYEFLHLSLIINEIKIHTNQNNLEEAYNKCLYHKELSKDLLEHYESIFYVCKDIYFLFKDYKQIKEILIFSQNKYIEEHDYISNYNLNIITDLLNFYSSMHDYNQSFKYAKESLDISKKLYALTDPNIAKLFNLYRVHESFIQVGKSLEIISILNQIVSEWEKKFFLNKKSKPLLKKDYYDLLDTLGTSYLQTNQFENSINIYKKQLNISNNLYGPNTEESAQSYWSLALVNFMKGNLEKSSENFTKQYEILSIIDPNHPKLINNLQMHSSIYATKNDYEGEKNLLKERLERAKNIGEKSNEYLEALIAYTDILYRNPLTRTEADQLFEQCFKLLTQQYKKGQFKYMGTNFSSDLLLAMSYFQFSDLYTYKGQYEKAADIQSSIIDPFLQNELSTSGYMNNLIFSLFLTSLSEVYIQLEDYENALKYLNYSIKYNNQDKSILALINLFTKIKIQSNISDHESALKTIKEGNDYINSYIQENCVSNKDDCAIQMFLWGLSNFEAIVNADKHLNNSLLLNNLDQNSINEIITSIKTLKFNLSEITPGMQVDLSIQKHHEPILDSLKYILEDSILDSLNSFNQYMNNELEFRKNVKVDFKSFEMSESLVSSTELSLPFQIGYNIYTKLESEINKKKLLNHLFVLTQLGESKKISDVIKKMTQRSGIKDRYLNDLLKNKQDKINDVRIISDQINKLMQNEIFSVKINFSLFTDKIKAINNDIIKIDQIIFSKYPDFSQFIDPQFVNLQDIQNNLSEKEAIIKYVLLDQSQYYVWVIKKNEVLFYPLKIKEKELNDLITKIRSTLNINNFSDFALKETKILYDQIFKIFENDILDIEHLLVILDNPLDSLPFGIICKVCETINPNNYSTVDFLIKQYDFTYFPDLTSFIELRKKSKDSKAKETLIGFANPNLSKKDSINEDDNLLALIDNKKFKKSITRSSIFDTKLAKASLITNLYLPLPETEEELLSVANYLNVENHHLFFGNKATEENVKKQKLSNYKIVYFATHGEIAGKFNENQEPFLILTPPDIPSNLDDGILTASEIMGLNLDAEWVILSACNTATGNQPGADGLTGLARSFFYAGARSLLVTNWEVETNAATFIVSETFKSLKEKNLLTKSQALKKAKLKFINKASDAWQTHPVIWSPFIIVGKSK